MIMKLPIKPLNAKNDPRVLGLAIFARRVEDNKKQLGLKLKQTTYAILKRLLSEPYYQSPSLYYV